MEETHPIPSTAMSEDRFLDWAGHQDGRLELVEGVVVMHAGATRRHERIAKRIFAALLARCDDRAYDVNKGDFGVRIGPGGGRGTILYPDVVVDPQSADSRERATTEPIVVVEVPSASTDYDEHLRKFERYKLRTSLRHYVVLDQDVPKAYVWHRQEAGWPDEPDVLEGPDAVLDFPAVRARVGLAEIYRPTEPTNLAVT